MELEELKTTWQSVKSHIDSQISENEANKIVAKKIDIKSRLLKRAAFEGIISVICIIMMALSRLWAPMKFPYWWLSIFCFTLLFANLYGIRIYRSLKTINLWENSHREILATVVSIKKLYRNIELATALALIPLFIWTSFNPLFVNSWKMILIWGLMILGFTLEYLWYKSNIKQFNNLVNWEKEL